MNLFFFYEITLARESGWMQEEKGKRSINFKGKGMGGGTFLNECFVIRTQRREDAKTQKGYERPQRHF
jgi:hypothetical protein